MDTELKMILHLKEEDLIKVTLNNRRKEKSYVFRPAKQEAPGDGGVEEQVLKAWQPKEDTSNTRNTRHQ